MENSYKIKTEEINLTAKGNPNTLTATTTATKPADMEEKDFASVVWEAVKKAVKAHHVKEYAHSTPDVAVVNAVYSVTYERETKTITIPLADVLPASQRTEYNNKANMLQNAAAKFLNGKYETPQARTAARSATEKAYKNVLQWAFDFLTEGRKDGVKIYVNSQDVDIISGMLVKLRREQLSTTGERTIQGFIEYAFRQKIAGKDFFVTVYSINKEQNGVKVTPTASQADENQDDDATAEETAE